MKKLVTIACSLLLLGCATSNVSKEYSLHTDSPNGLLVGSIKYVGPLSGYSVHYRGLDNNETGYFEAGKGVMLIPIPPESDFPNVNGKLQAVELTPGEYEISNWSVTSGAANLRQTSPFSIKFRIEPGKATYIGSFVFSVTNTLGLTVTGVKVNYEDQHENDISILKKLYPGLSGTEVYMGLEKGLVKENIGGSSSTSWNMPIVLTPAGL